MRTRTTKSSRPSRRTSQARRSTAEKIRRYLPLAAVICAGAYLPPKIIGAGYNWIGGDVDAATWGTTTNWSPTGAPIATGDTATFSTNFTLNRTVNLNVSSALASITVNDPKPLNTLTIAGTGGTFKLDSTTSLTLNPAFNNTLSISALLENATTGGKLIKNGLGTVILSADNTYTGSTTLNSGIVQVSKLTSGGTAGPLGASTKSETNLLFNGGVLRYTGAAVSIDRSFTVLDDVLTAEGDLARAAGTLDGSGSGALVFNDAGSGVIKGSPNPQQKSTLVLRGTFGAFSSGAPTSTTANQLDVLLTNGDGGGPLNLLKTDTGAWRITKDNNYTGDTIVQRGTLSVDYRGLPGSRIPNESRLIFGGLPGGGIVDLITSGVEEEATRGFVLKSGANALQGTNGTGTNNAAANGGQYFSIPNLNLLKQDPDNQNFDKDATFFRTPGATLRMNNTALIQTSSGIPLDVRNFGGWLTINDDWVSVQQATSGKFNTVGFATLPNAYVTANGPTGLPDNWAKNDNIDITGHLDLPLDTTQLTGGLKDIWSLRFNANPTPSKALILADHGFQPSVLNIAGGGLMQTSGSGNSHIIGGVLTSQEGELFINVRANNLLIESAIEDFLDVNGGNTLTSVGFTKWGTGTLILQPKKDVFATEGPQVGQFVPAPPTNFSGNVYVNEGTLVVRQPDGLGSPTGTPESPNVSPGKTRVNGGVLDFQGVQYKRLDPWPNPVVVDQEVVEVYSGSVAATQGRSGFAGEIQSLNKDAPMTLNVNGNALLEIGLKGVDPDPAHQNPVIGKITGVSGFSKVGTGTLVVNGDITITPNTTVTQGAVYLGVSDISLTAGNSIFNGGINLGSAGSVNVTAGNNSINGVLNVARVVVTGASATSSFLGLNSPSGNFGADFIFTGGTALLASPVQPVGNRQIYGGNVVINGGTVVVNNSVDFAGTFNFSAGSFSEIANVVPGSIPLVRFTNTTAGSVVFGLAGATATAQTVTLQGNTSFASAPVINPFSTLTLTGLGTTTFSQGINATSSGTYNLVNATIAPNGFTLSNGTANFNGLNTIGGTFTINNGTFAQAGTRRGIVAGNTVGGIYGVRDKFAAAAFNPASNPNPIAIVVNNTGTAGSALSPRFNGANEIVGNIQIQGTSPGFNGFTTTTEAYFSNSQTILGNSAATGSTGNLRLMGGRVVLESAQALGDGVAAGSVGQYTLGQGGGVTITAEKSVLLLQRGAAITGTVTSVGGVATAANNEDIVIGPTTGYLSGIVVTNRGSAYSGPTVTIGGGVAPAGGTLAVGTVNLSGTAPNSIASVSFTTNVGGGYTAAPYVAFGGTAGSGATGVAVLAGPIIRTNDQHSVWGGSIILDNVSTTAATGAVGQIAAGTPILAVGPEDSLAIKGNIFGGGTATAATAASRYLTTALPGNANNASSGFIILDGQVRDISTGFTTTAKDQLRTEWGGNNELQVLVNNNWNANGLVTLSQGTMRFTQNTAGAGSNFFAAGVTPNFELSVAALNNTSVGWNAGNVPINLFLTKDGQVFNAPSFTVHNGNTDKIGLSGNSTGNITIGGENTGGTKVTFGTGAGTILLETEAAAQIRDLRLYAAQGGTVDIKAALGQSTATVGSGSITKIGDGTVRLLGTSGAQPTNLLTRAYLVGGTLEFAGFDIAATNNARLSSAPGVAGVQTYFGGGNLRIQGNATGGLTVVQQLNGQVNILKGGSAISIVDNTTGGTPNTSLVLGSQSGIRRDVGGTLRITEGKASGLSTGANSANILLGTTTAVSATGTSLGTIQNVLPIGFSTYGTDTNPLGANAALYFTQRNGATTVEAYNPAGYSNTGSNSVSGWGSGAQVSEANGGPGFSGSVPLSGGVFAIGSIRFGATAATAGTVDIAAGGLLTITEGILVSSDAGGANRAINGGKITAGTKIAGVDGYAGDLIIHNYGGNGLVGGTGPSLTIGSQITGTKALTLAGDGTTILTNNANDFTGNIYVNNGVLSVSNNGQLGNTGNQVLLEGGTIGFTEDHTLTRIITAYGDRSTVSIAPNKTLTLNSTTFNLRSDANLIGGAYAGTNLYNGDLALSGGGTVRQVIDGGGNPFFGRLIVTGGTKYISETNNGNFFGNGVSYSTLDGTAVEAGSTVELRSTNPAAYNITEFFTLAGSGQNGQGALRFGRAQVGPTVATDREISLFGPVNLSDDATITVTDALESIGTSITASTPGFVGILNLNDNIVDGGGKALTKDGPGILRFVNNRTENLPTINVVGGELRFESGITGVIGASAGFNTPLSQLANHFSGTNTINVGGTIATPLSTPFTANPRLWFNDARGVHTTDINLSGGFMLVNSADAPLQSVNFGGTVTVSGGAGSVTWDSLNGRLINNSPNALEVETTSSRANPTVMFGPLNGSGSLVKFGRNELQIVNANTSASAFSGDLVLSRGGFSSSSTTGGVLIGSPSLGLYDGGALPQVHAIYLTNDASIHLDNQNGLDTNVPTSSITSNDNQSESPTNAVGRLKNNVELHFSGGSRFRLIGYNATTGPANQLTTTKETVGKIFAHSGASSVELDPGVNGTTYRGIGLAMGEYSRDAGGTIQFRVLKDMTFVSPQTTLANGLASLSMQNVPSQFFVGGATGALGEVGAGKKTNVIVGAFGGAATSAFSSLPGNTTIPIGLNNNEQFYVARHFLTWDPANKTVRPLIDAEKYQPTTTGITAETIFFLPSDATNQNQNLELKGGFGPFTSASTESLTADEGVFVLPGSDSSRKQDTAYVLRNSLQVNTLRFAPQVTEFISGAGNRILLELKDGATMSLSSGMILNGAFGTLQDNDSNTGDVTDQRMYIRGGTINADAREFIIHNTAASFRENSGTWANSNADLNIFSTLAGTGGLTKSGLGLVSISGQNTYSGTTTVSEGILRLNNDKSLGNSQLLVINALGDVRYGRGVTIGTPAKPVTVRMTNSATQNNLLVEGQYNIWNGDIQIDNLTSAGERPYSANLQNNGAGAMVLNGNIYGFNSAAGGTDALNDIQRGRGPKQLVLTGVGGVFTLNGFVRDTPTGPISSINSANEIQVLRSFLHGSSNETMYYLNRPWDSAGSLAFRRGNVQLEAAAGGSFFTHAAAASINPYFANSRTTFTDTDTGSSGDVSITLTTGGQVFNTPQMNVGTTVADATKTLISTNQTGSTLWFNTSGSNLSFDATQHTSLWDSIVRLYSTATGPGDVMNIEGRISATAGQNSGLAKIGPGTVSMKGMPQGVAGYSTTTSPLNDFSKQIVAAGGTLELDYDTYHLGVVANAWGTPAVIPVLGGGHLELKGDSQNVTNQTWGGLTVRSGGSEIYLASGASNKLNLTIGGNLLQLPAGATGVATAPTSTLNRSGGTVNFVNHNPAGPNAATLTLTAVGSVTTGTGSTGGFITALPASGAQPVVMASWATYGTNRNEATDWAARNNAGVVTAFNQYNTNNDPATWNPTPNGLHMAEGATAFTGSTAANLGFKTIKFGAPGTISTLNLPSGFKLGTNVADLTAADEGGILVPTGTTARKTIAGGTLQGNTLSVADIYIHNYGSGGLSIATELTGAQNFVFTGSGTTTLTANRNTNTGTTYISNGVLEVNSIAANTNATTPTGVALTVVMKPHLDSAGIPVAGQFDPSNAATVLSATGFFVGQKLFSTNGLFPEESVVTGISGTTIEFSKNAIGATQGAGPGPSGVGSVGNQLGNSVGASSTTGLVFNGGTLRYTQTTAGFETFSAFSPAKVVASLTVPTARPITLGGTGGTFQIDDPGVNLQLDGVVTSVQNAALQTGTSTSYQSRNNYVGDLIKTGAGTLTLSNANAANTYTGLTDVRAGTLATVSTSSSVFGSSYGELDGTIVRGSANPALAATLRLSPSGAVSIPEWITMENNTTIDVKYASAAQQVVTLDGVLTLGSRIDPGYPSSARDVVNITYNGDLVKTGVGAAATYAAAANAGNAVLNLNSAGGYLRGSAIIHKGTVYGAVQNTSTGNTPIAFASSTFGTSVGGVLVFNESSPEFTGTLIIDGGRVVVKSLGLPLGTGVLPIQLGNSGSNFYDTGGIATATNPTAIGTLATANVFPEANLFFQAENAVSVNGGTSSAGSLDSVPGQYRILQDIIINKTRPYVDPNPLLSKPAGIQTKQLGVTTTTLVGPGLGNNMPLSQDSFNFDGRILFDDDVNLYLDDNATLHPAAGAIVNLNLNNKLVTGQPNANPLYDPAQTMSNGYQPQNLGNITTKIFQTGRAAGAEMGVYNDLFFNINVNGDNREFGGAWTIGNVAVLRSASVPEDKVSNPDANHVITVGSSLAFNRSNQVKLLDDATFRVNGFNTAIGSLVTDTTGGLDPIEFNPPGNPFGSNPNYSPNPVNSVGLPLTIENFTTADVPRNIHAYDDSSFQNDPMIRAILENGASGPANLTINQTANSYWNVFIRNGVTSTGAAAGALTITKDGNGIAQIEQGNIYTGGTVINGGYLQIENDVTTTSATGTGVVTINHGGGISGNGNIAGHVHVSGSIRPGTIDLLTGSDQGGILSFRGGTELHTGTTLDFELRGDGSEGPGLATGRDTLFSTSITIDGRVSLQLKIDPASYSGVPSTNPTDPAGGDGSRFTLLTTVFDDFTTGGPILFLPTASFDFYGVPTGIGQDVVYNYGGGSQYIFRLVNDNGGRSLTLVAVPEPGTATTLLSGAAMLLGLQRFRRRSRRTAV